MSRGMWNIGVANNKWKYGGAKRRNKFDMELSQFAELLVRFEGLGGNVKAAVTDALDQLGETVAEDTREALVPAKFPRQGRYSTGDTARSLIEHPKTEWSGNVATINVGFDHSKPGAGGFLISGTPRQEPVHDLEQIYARAKYMDRLQNDALDVISDYIDYAMNG